MVCGLEGVWYWAGRCAVVGRKVCGSGLEGVWWWAGRCVVVGQKVCGSSGLEDVY